MATPQRTLSLSRSDAEQWAERLAAQLATRRTPPAAPTEQITAAVGMLWALFDETMIAANCTLEAAGLPERIRVRRRPDGRTYYLDGTDEPSRHILITVSLRAAAGHISGGALLAAGRTRACAFLVPSFGRGEARWRTQPVGTLLHACIVRDLFLSTFADDPAATHRLSPLSGSDFFSNPWS